MSRYRKSKAAETFGCAALFFLLLLPAFAAAQDGDDPWALVDEPAKPKALFSGDLQNRTKVHLVDDNAYEDFFSSRALLYGKGLFGFGDRLSVTLSGIGEYEIRVNSEGRANGSRYRADLEEFFADVHLGRLDLRLGQQLVHWGTADVVNPTDTINPVDTRYLVDRELGHEKIPNLMAKANLYLGDWYMEGIFLPFFRPARIDFLSGDWSLFGNRVPVAEVTGLLDETRQGRLFLLLLNHYIPGWDDTLEETLSSERLNVLGPQPPMDDLTYWEAAYKVGVSWGPTDWSWSYFYTQDDLPTLNFSPGVRALFQAFLEGQEDLRPALVSVLDDLNEGELLDSTYPRLHQFGMDFSANLGPSVLRGEGVCVLGRHLYTEELETVERPMITYTVAADYQFPLNILFNLQALQVITLSHREDLLSDPMYTFLISYLRGDFFDDTFEVYAEILYNTSFWSVEGWRQGDIFGEDFQFTGKAAYDILPDLSLGAGVMVFGGPRDQLLAVAHEKSFGFLDLTYSF